MAKQKKQNSYITGSRVERPDTLADSDLRRADWELLESYQAVMRLIDSAQADKRTLEQGLIRYFIAGRSERDGPMATPPPPPPLRPMATRNPTRYNMAGIAISIALIVGSILAAVWLAKP